MNRNLHIVCPDAPFPADCGHSIDMFEKISSLQRCGVGVHLHFFKCNDKGSDGLNDYCECIHGYTEFKKATNIDLLIDQLNANDFPIIFENIYHPKFSTSIIAGQRKIMMRVHNEDLCGKEMEDADKILFSRFFPRRTEEKKTGSLPPGYLYACISMCNVISLRQKYHLPRVEYLPPFVAWNEIKCGQGMGNFCLYHGNLSDPANEKTAIWLLEKVFPEVRFPCIIAGKNPSRRIHKLAELYSNTCIVANPSKKEIDELVQKAHINIVPSLRPGRIYKLLHSLFEGRHCITNEMAVLNTDLSEACHIANDSRSKIAIIKELIAKPFTNREIELRKNLLLPRYDNAANTHRLLDWLY